MPEDSERQYRLFARENAVLSMMVDALEKFPSWPGAMASYRLRERMTENQCCIHELKGITGLVRTARPHDPPTPKRAT